MAKYRVDTDKGSFMVETEDPVNDATKAVQDSAKQVGVNLRQPGAAPNIPGLNSPGIPGQDPSKPGIDLSGLDPTEQQLNNRGSQALLGTAVGGPVLGAMNAISPPSTPGEAVQSYGLGAASKLPGVGTVAQMAKGAVLNPALDWLKGKMDSKEASNPQLGIDSAVGAAAPVLGKLLGQSVDKVNANKVEEEAKQKLQDLLTSRTRAGQRLGMAGRDVKEATEALKATQAAREADLATGSKITPERFKLADAEKQAVDTQKWRQAQKSLSQQNVDQLDDILAPMKKQLPEKQADILDKIGAAAKGVFSHGGGLGTAAYLIFHHPVASAAAGATQAAISIAWPKIITALQDDPKFGSQFVNWMKDGATRDLLQAYPAVQKMLNPQQRDAGKPISIADLTAASQ